jgi:hypothetical protein
LRTDFGPFLVSALAIDSKITLVPISAALLSQPFEGTIPSLSHFSGISELIEAFITNPISVAPCLVIAPSPASMMASAPLGKDLVETRGSSSAQDEYGVSLPCFLGFVCLLHKNWWYPLNLSEN